MLLSNASLGKHKEPQSYKRYGLKTSTSDEVRQGCLHFFPISQGLSPKSACLTDREHPQATSCKPIYHGKPVICNFCSHSAKPAWRLQTKWYGKLCRSVIQGADKVETESIFFCECRFFSFRTVSTRTHAFETDNFGVNHNYNKILESDWLSTALISALIGQYAPSRAHLNGFFSLLAKKIGISFVLIKKKSLIHHKFC